MDAAALAKALGSDLEHGLDAAEAARRLQAYGPNELRARPPVPAWRRALAQLQEPLVYLLGAAAAVALAAWWFEGRGRPGLAGWPLDALVIALPVPGVGVSFHDASMLPLPSLFILDSFV
jgi:magnesium-transporting ATPase (P-type)